MNPTDYELYWKTAAENHLSIAHSNSDKHFCSYSVEEIISGLKNLKSPCLALEDPEYIVEGELTDNVGLMLNGAVLILKKMKESSNYLEQTAARKDMFPIAWDLYTKLRNDRKKANMGTASGPAAKLRNISSIRIIPIGPVFDGWAGWRLEYAAPANINPDLSETNWQNETKFSI